MAIPNLHFFIFGREFKTLRNKDKKTIFVYILKKIKNHPFI